MYDRIMVPIDESDGPDAVAAARPLARLLGCALTLLHVHHPQEAPVELEGLPQFRYQGVVETWDGRDREAEEHEVEWLNRLADEVAADEAGMVVTSRLVHAPLSRRLRDDGEQVLVVAALQDAHLDGLPAAVRELLVGGGVPVLLVRAGHTLLPLGRMLITLDGSPFSCEVIRPALDLARATSARVSLLEVVTRHNGLVRLLRPGERSAESAERFLRRVRSEIGEELGAVDVRVVEKGNAAAGIVEEARRGGVDVVAMATHGRGGLRRLILGSVAESVVRGSALPMLLYRPLAVDAGEPAWGSERAAVPLTAERLGPATT